MNTATRHLRHLLLSLAASAVFAAAPPLNPTVTPEQLLVDVRTVQFDRHPDVQTHADALAYFHSAETAFAERSPEHPGHLTVMFSAASVRANEFLRSLMIKCPLDLPDDPTLIQRIQQRIDQS